MAESITKEIQVTKKVEFCSACDTQIHMSDPPIYTTVDGSTNRKATCDCSVWVYVPRAERAEEQPRYEWVEKEASNGNA